MGGEFHQGANGKKFHQGELIMHEKFTMLRRMRHLALIPATGTHTCTPSFSPRISISTDAALMIVRAESTPTPMESYF